MTLLIMIAEPIYRTHLIHEYKVTKYSLYAAIALGFKTDEMKAMLQKWSKVEIPRSVLEFIDRFSERYGKVKIVLKRGGYLIESVHEDILEELLQNYAIAEAYQPTFIPGLPLPDPSLGMSALTVFCC